MSQEEQDAIVGRTVRELREAKERLAMLKAEAGRRGERLKNAGHFLAAYPEYMVQEGESVDVRFSSQPQKHLWTAADIYPAEEILKLTSAIRAEVVKIATLNERLMGMGHYG